MRTRVLSVIAASGMGGIQGLAGASATTDVPHAIGTPPGGERRAVVELFTSQGCSSCPPADALAGRLSADPTLLVLSFHVTYWDDLGWKDRFSLQASTDRQYAYARWLREPSVFTPQIVVNGTKSLVGSQETGVRSAITAATGAAFAVQTKLSTQPDGSFQVELNGPAVPAEVWEVRYVRHAATQIQAGENGGRSLETFNNVTRVQHLGSFHAGVMKLPALRAPDDGLAVLVQTAADGRIIGATAY
jgi:hypothetical protein